MPKLSSALRRAVGGSPPISAGEIARRLADAEAAVRELSAVHERAALQAEAGMPGAAEHLESVTGRLETARTRVATLQSALAAAMREDELARQRVQTKLRKDNLAKVSAAFERRDKAAERLARAIADAADAYRELIDSSAQAVLPIPGITYPDGSLTGLAEIRQAVEREIYRVGSAPLNHGCDFPGGKPHEIMTTDNPGAIRPLVDEVKDASAYVNRVLQGEPAEVGP